MFERDIVKFCILERMSNNCRSYIAGDWVSPAGRKSMSMVNPSSEGIYGALPLGVPQDINHAVTAAKEAFPSFSRTATKDRVELLGRLKDEYGKRFEDLAEAMTKEMGSPISLSRSIQAQTGIIHLETTMSVMQKYAFEEVRGSTCVVKEPIGICGLITPWNWPINQIACKLFPAIGAGCTVVWKPSEFSPLSAQILAEIFDSANAPSGVFNMVHGTGEAVGKSLAAHPDVDMISFTGSVRAGAHISQEAGATIKRITTELGGKSANILLDDAMFEEGVNVCMALLLVNSGQSCAAPTRLLVPRTRLEEAAEIAAKSAQSVVIGDASDHSVTLGPLANEVQFNRVQTMIARGIEEGAKLVAGGLGRPEGLKRGYFVRPTIFSEVDNDFDIAREEIFGPVLCIIPYTGEEEAISIANDSEYGLSGYVYCEDRSRAISIARKLRTGSVFINGADIDPMAPLGGFKKSGNGREWGIEGFEEFLETKSLIGFGADTNSSNLSLK